MSWFQAGDVVVCVDDTPKPEWVAYLGGHYTLPAKGVIYRVDMVLTAPDGSVGLQLVGLKNNHPDRGFCARRFRKIDKADDSFIAQVRACKPTTSTPSHEQEVR